MVNRSGWMSWEPTSLLDLDNWRSRPPWLLTVVLPGSGGGRFGESPVEIIAENPGARALRICGLDQPAFERLVAGYGSQFSAIIFHGCQRVADLSPLEDLPGLRLVSWQWNQRATRLWDMCRTPRLTGLKVEDFIHLRALDDVRGYTGLEELVFGDGIASRKAVFESLEPLAALENLRYLEFCVRQFDDGRIQPLGKLSRLQELRCPVNLFTTRQLAWLRARLPAAQSQALDPVMPLGQVLTLDRKPKDVTLVGKRKPALNSVTDQARITKHVDEFWQMVEDFRQNPALEPG
jgi:hypothetical protein